MLTAFFTAVSPYLYQIILGLFVLYIAPELEKFLQVKSDDSRREYIEEAMLNGLSVAMITVPECDEQTAIQYALEYTKDTCPDALGELKITDDTLANILKVRYHLVSSGIITQENRGATL